MNLCYIFHLKIMKNFFSDRPGVLKQIRVTANQNIFKSGLIYFLFFAKYFMTDVYMYFYRCILFIYLFIYI